MQFAISHATQRATRQPHDGEERARGKDFTCFNGFGAKSANLSLSPPMSGLNPKNQ
jgi:hypothetical protein